MGIPEAMGEEAEGIDSLGADLEMEVGIRRPRRVNRRRLELFSRVGRRLGGRRWPGRPSPDPPLSGRDKRALAVVPPRPAVVPLNSSGGATAASAVQPPRAKRRQEKLVTRGEHVQEYRGAYGIRILA